MDMRAGWNFQVWLQVTLTCPDPLFIDLEEGNGTLRGVIISSTGHSEVTASAGDMSTSAKVRGIPGILSILPPLLAIFLALAFRQVVIALVAGTWLGAIFLFDYDIIGGFYRVMDYFIINAVTDPSKAQIIVFSMMFGGDGRDHYPKRWRPRYCRPYYRFCQNTPQGAGCQHWQRVFSLF